jgi:insulysin
LNIGVGKFDSGMKIAEVNSFIPENFQVYYIKSESSDKIVTSSSPKIVMETDRVRLWYKQDDTFLIPKANCNYYKP